MRLFWPACCLTTLFLAACNGEMPMPIGDCRPPEGGLLYIQPTSTPLADPELTPTPTPDAQATSTATPTPTTTATPTSTPLPYCTPTPTPAGSSHPTATPFSRGRGAGDVRNLTLNLADDAVEAVAAGRYLSAVAWREGLQLAIALTGGGSDFDSRLLGVGEQVTMAFSLTDRLHVAYTNNGLLYYRAAEAGTHPADAPDEIIGTGGQPDLAIDADGWAHLFFVVNGTVQQRTQGPAGWSQSETIAPGDTTAATFTEDGSLVVVVKQGNLTHIYRQDTPGASWSPQSTFDTGHTVIGAPQIDADGQWVYIAFVSERLDPYSGDWPNFRPEYKPAAPWANRVHSGANAQQYFTRFAVHNAGVYQQVQVTGNLLSLTAWGQVWSSDEPCEPLNASCNPTDMRLQIGLDPSGGLNPAGSSVVWSPPINPVDTYLPMSVSAAAQGSLATVYLKSNPQQPRSHNDVYWDSVNLAGGLLLNGDFELGFPEYSGIAELKVAERWHPFYREDGIVGVSDGRYIVHAAWSNDSGLTWSDSFDVIQNEDAGSNQTGRFTGNAYPIIALGNELAPTVSFLVVYEEGDPPPTQPAAWRYGRPRLATCDLGGVVCTDSPGERLLSAQATRPTSRLVVGVSPDRQRGILAWDAWQPGATARDVYATSIQPQALEE